jgi:uncharacterized membrane-anchored protein YhcB (DUF1043 family)
MKFLAGVIVGIVIGRPVVSLANERLTPPARRKITETLHNITQRLNDRIEQENN